MRCLGAGEYRTGQGNFGTAANQALSLRFARRALNTGLIDGSVFSWHQRFETWIESINWRHRRGYLSPCQDFPIAWGLHNSDRCQPELHHLENIPIPRSNHMFWLLLSDGLSELWRLSPKVLRQFKVRSWCRRVDCLESSICPVGQVQRWRACRFCNHRSQVWSLFQIWDWLK